MPEDTYENNPLRREFERESDDMQERAIAREGQDIADAIGLGGEGSPDGGDDVLMVLREILEVMRDQRVEVNQRLEEIRAAVETSSGGAGEWG